MLVWHFLVVFVSPSVILTILFLPAEVQLKRCDGRNERLSVFFVR